MIMVRAVTVGIHTSPSVCVPHRTHISQDWHDEFPSNHRVVTWMDGLQLAQVPRCALSCWLDQIELSVVFLDSEGIRLRNLQTCPSFNLTGLKLGDSSTLEEAYTRSGVRWTERKQLYWGDYCLFPVLVTMNPHSRRSSSSRVSLVQSYDLYPTLMWLRRSE